jgi:MFS family permease
MPVSTESTTTPRRLLALFALIAAGETIFFLPFVLARVFRPTVLEVFGLTNLELGIAFSIYGVVAMVSYLPSGPLADLFPPRWMIAVALVSTASGGLWMASGPTLTELKILYAAWGFTTIALFWSALIRATREWGGSESQGLAFGLLDGGRGLVTAMVGSVLVVVFASLLPDDPAAASLAEKSSALNSIILLLAGAGVLVAALVLVALPGRGPRPHDGPSRFEWSGVRHLLRLPTVWLQAVIIICAYVGFKATDDFSLYARDLLGSNDVDSARFATVSLWMRPIAAVGAGLLADRFGSVRLTIISFLLLLAGSAFLASGQAMTVMLFLTAVVTASLGIFALRGLYYAVMREGKVPLAWTGTAVGIVSVLGYTPDVFMPPLMGYLLDTSPGVPGHQHVFAVIGGFSVIGLAASVAFHRCSRG